MKKNQQDKLLRKKRSCTEGQKYNQSIRDRNQGQQRKSACIKDTDESYTKFNLKKKDFLCKSAFKSDKQKAYCTGHTDIVVDTTAVLLKTDILYVVGISVRFCIFKLRVHRLIMTDIRT